MIASVGLLALAGFVRAQSAISLGTAYGTAYSADVTASEVPKWQNYTLSIPQASSSQANITTITITDTKAISTIFQIITETLSLNPVQSSACFTTTVTATVALSVTEKHNAPEPTGPIFYNIDEYNSTTFLNGAIPSGASIVYASEPTVVVITPVPAESVSTESTSTTTLTSTVFATLTMTMQRPSNSAAPSEEDVTITATETIAKTKTLTIATDSISATGIQISAEKTTTIKTTSTTTGTILLTMTRNWNTTTTAGSDILNGKVLSTQATGSPLVVALPSNGTRAQEVSTTAYLLSAISSSLPIISMPSITTSISESSTAENLTRETSVVASDFAGPVVYANTTGPLITAPSESILPSATLLVSSGNSSVIVLTQSYTKVITSYTAVPVTSTVGESMGGVVTLSGNNTIWTMTISSESASGTIIISSAAVTKPMSSLEPSRYASSIRIEIAGGIPPPSTWNPLWGHGPVVHPTSSTEASSSKVTEALPLVTMPGPIIISQSLTVESAASNVVEEAKASITPKPAQPTTAVADDVAPGFMLHGRSSTLIKVAKK